MPIDEVELSGGNLTSGIVRVGDTVRRPAGAWTPAVHALLLHLEKAGFEASPRVLGIDQRGREILTYIAGRVAWPWENFAPVATRDGLSKIAQIIHAYHAAVSSFVPPRDAKWSELCPRNGAEIICHNDFAPWNLIVGPSGSFTFIDWDLAAPGPRLSDLAYSARRGAGRRTLVASLRCLGRAAFGVAGCRRLARALRPRGTSRTRPSPRKAMGRFVERRPRRGA